VNKGKKKGQGFYWAPALVFRIGCALGIIAFLPLTDGFTVREAQLPQDYGYSCWTNPRRC
jgi:hypothetical protein